MPRATEGCASRVRMSMPSTMFPAQQQQTRIKSFRYQHRRLLTETLSPILSWKQSIHAEEYFSNSTPTDYREQTSSALSFHAASKLWTSDELGYIREDIIVSSPSRTDLSSASVQGVWICGIVFGPSGFGLILAYHNHRFVRNGWSTVRRCSLSVPGSCTSNCKYIFPQ